MTTETEQEKKAESAINPKFQKVLENITEEIGTKYSSEFDIMCHSDEWKIEEETFHYVMPNHKRLGELRALQAVEIDEQKDWDTYVDNYKKRACLLIKEMTPEKFDELPYYRVENLVTAWSVRSNRGFC
jgi:sulfatase maturation enzyme AslB (radical SAM superfamily)